MQPADTARESLQRRAHRLLWSTTVSLSHGIWNLDFFNSVSEFHIAVLCSNMLRFRIRICSTSLLADLEPVVNVTLKCITIPWELSNCFNLCLCSRLSRYVWLADVYLLSCENLIVNPLNQINKYSGDQKRILLVESAKWPVALLSKP